MGFLGWGVERFRVERFVMVERIGVERFRGTRASEGAPLQRCGSEVRIVGLSVQVADPIGTEAVRGAVGGLLMTCQPA